ncbi:MAG: hypothetical protein ACPL3C_12620, partial [Pyrobaculum sp.]
GDPPQYAVAPYVEGPCLLVEADGVLYSPAVSLSSLTDKPRFMGFLLEEGPGALGCRHLWPPAVAEGRRPVRLVKGGVGLTPAGAVKILEFPEGYPAYYTRSVLRLYGVDAGGHIAEPAYAPGGGFHLGEEFGVVAGDFVLLKSSRGVDYALNLILGVWRDKWIFLGDDGLYEGVFIPTGGEKGEVGYLKITAPFREDVRLVEGPPVIGEFLPRDCGFYSPLTRRCYSERGLEVVRRWPVERIEAVVYAQVLEKFLASDEGESTHSG